MPSHAATRQVGKVAIIDLSGRLTIPDGTELLRNRIKDLMGAGQTSVVLNLSEITYMDSAGIGELVSACSTLRKAGGNLKLVNPQERIINLLKMTNLSNLFEVFADEQAALASF